MAIEPTSNCNAAFKGRSLFPSKSSLSPFEVSKLYADKSFHLALIEGVPWTVRADKWYVTEASERENTVLFQYLYSFNTSHIL